MFHVYWPACAALTMFMVVFTIFAMLRYGADWCKLRHTTLPTYHNRHVSAAYEQQISYA